MHIIVNATALASSGGLSILKQFIEEIPKDEFQYVIFVSNEISLSNTNQNIRLVGRNVKSNCKRFLWDAFGVKKWLFKNKILPIATISLQNTNFRVGKLHANFIYYHQPLPLYKIKWNAFKPNQKTLWFYKNIYPFFVNLFMNKNTEVFVQSNFIKESFSRRFKVPESKIHVIAPKLNISVLNKTYKTFLYKDQINLFYPATPLIYKNHSTLIKAITLIDENLQKKITLTLTCFQNEIRNLIKNSNIHFNIEFVGTISTSKVLENYRIASAVVFPSYIETFGLPLLEAASFGLPIITSDLPYAHEILNTYEGATYVEYDNPIAWSKQITNLLSEKNKRFQPIEITQYDSWPKLFKIIKAKIN